MKWIRGLLVVFILGGGIVPLLPTRAAAFGGGNGSSGAPYQIATCADTQNITDNHYYVLTSDVDCTGQAFTPNNTVTGVSVDGQGHVLKGVHFAAPLGGYAGWFLVLTSSTVKNVRILDVSMSSNQSIGAIAASGGHDTVQDVSVDGDIAGSGARTGMLFGETVNSVLQRVAAHGTMSVSSGYNGGLAGLFHGSITDSFSDVDITGQSAIGGLVGYLYGPDGSPAYSGPATISRSYAAGSINNASGTSASIAAIMEFDSSISDSVGLTTMVGSASRFGILGGNASSAATPLSNNFFDQSLTGATSCGGASGCTAVDADGSDGAHFDGNSSAAPFNSWNFSSVWRTRINRPPALRSLPTAPDYPAKVWIGTPTATTLTIHWDDGDNGGSPITGYQVRYGVYGSSSLATINTTSRTVTLTGLNPSTEYEFEIRAGNAYGWAPWRGAVTFTAAQAVTTSSASANQANTTIGRGGTGFAGDTLPPQEEAGKTAVSQSTTTTSNDRSSTGTNSEQASQPQAAEDGGNLLVTMVAAVGGLVLFGLLAVFIAGRFKQKA